MPRADDAPQRTPIACRILDAVIGVALVFLVIWGPWALGCTTHLTLLILTWAGIGVGGLSIAKRIVCWVTGFEIQKWSGSEGSRWPVRILSVVWVLVVGYVLVSAINRRGELFYTHNEADPNRITGVDLKVSEAIEWLPSSYDAKRSLNAFFRYLGLAGLFWAARDWMLTKSRKERHRPFMDGVEPFPNDRVKALLWLFILSGAALALAGVIQRLDGTNKLLWLFDFPGRGFSAFGPFAYRGNGAQYLNLVWPVALGFWWTLREQARRRSGVNIRAGGDAHVMLLPLVILITAGVAVTSSRGGFAVMAALLLIAVLILATARRATAWLRVGLLLVLVAAAGAGFVLGGSHLQARFRSLRSDQLHGRDRVYEISHRIAHDFPVWGSGAETFSSMYAFYRDDEHEAWEAYAHNDWLETRITFGEVGLAMICVVLALILLANVFGDGLGADREFRWMLLLALAGVLIHAAFDFPFQIHGILYTFGFLAALATAATRQR